MYIDVLEIRRLRVTQLVHRHKLTRIVSIVVPAQVCASAA